MGDRWKHNRPSESAWSGRGAGRGAWKNNQNSKPPNSNATSNNMVPAKFKEASDSMLASVQKHISNYESSSDEEDLEEASILGMIRDDF